MFIQPKFSYLTFTGALLALAVPAFADDGQQQQLLLQRQHAQQLLLPPPQQEQISQQSQPPKAMQDGGITYISGGIGDGELDAIQSQAHDYNLQITNTTPNGEYTAHDSFEITSHDGNPVISVNDVGPLFYAKLPPGSYTVQATNINGVQRKQHVTISSSKPTKLHMIWQES